MLLDEALKSAGLFKYFFKILSLFILRNILGNNVSFISITNQESDAIKKYFPKLYQGQIPNKIPFEIYEQNFTNKNKDIVYFGRIHPHKNLELLINSFLSANLDEKWNLKIYGIKDDQNYYQKLMNTIDGKKNIQILEPIFGKEKQKVIASSWANILVSKSEVLSLSILESSYFGLPTIANEEIELSNYSNLVYPVRNSLNSIKEKIKEITSWTDDYQRNKSNEIKNKFKEKLNLEDTKKSYQKYYSDIKSEEIIKDEIFPFLQKFITLETFRFILISTVYTFNLMFSSLIVVFLAFFKNFSLAAEMGIVTSFWISLTQIFSSNMRSIITSENNLDMAKETLLYRFFFSIILLSAFYVFLNTVFLTEYVDFIFSITLLILAQWIFEMSLVKYEIKNQNNVFYIFQLINVILVILIITLIAQDQLELITTFIFIYVSIILLLILFELLALKKTTKKFIEVIKTNIKSIAFISSLSIISSSFIWRLFIFHLFEKNVAGMFYACFSVGSFPGTLFNSVIGPTYVKKKINLNKQIKIFIQFLVFLVFAIFIYSSLQIYGSQTINPLSLEFMIFVTSISLLGSYFMCIAMYNRHKEIQKSPETRINLFKTDVIYGMSITFFVPFLFWTFGSIGTSFSFFCASLFAYFMYVRLSIIN